MKFSAGIIVLNGMPYLPYLLRNIYPVMDEIVIVEGAALSAAESATAAGHSLDDTVAALNIFSDPERKIKFIQKDGFWNEKDEMSQAYAAECSGDYLWQIDMDEFYHHHDVQWIKHYLAENPEIGAVSFKTLNFFRGVEAVAKGARFSYGDDQFWRLFRWGRGYTYATHRPPTVLDRSGVDTRKSGVLYGNDLARQQGIYLYHYSYVLPAQVQHKTRYHESLGRFHRIKHHSQWYEDHFLHFTPYRVQMSRRPLSWLEPFRGVHPPEIQEMLLDASAGHIHVDFSTPPEIQRLLESSWRWRFWKILGHIDAVIWRIYDESIRALLRPFVRPIRKRFFGYRYDE